MNKNTRNWESVHVAGHTYVMTAGDAFEGSGWPRGSWLCEHVADLLDAGASKAGCACDDCGGSSCDECVCSCDRCECVLCPACAEEHETNNTGCAS